MTTVRIRKKSTIKRRSPVPPPTVVFRDRKKEAKKRACRGCKSRFRLDMRHEPNYDLDPKGSR